MASRASLFSSRSARQNRRGPTGVTSDCDTFIQRVSVLGTDDGAPLLRAGTVPMNLLEVLQTHKKPIDDPVTAQAIPGAYNVGSDHQALVKFAQNVVWLPPYRPAPFVGHMGRPYVGDNLYINALGFRDRRQTYVNKPERTVRVFLTGGSTAWGVGASSQEKTISAVLEELLNDRVAPTSGFRYEVINAAFPAWSTTQEKLLIQQRLVDMHPDVIIMLSGNNDIHWCLADRDVRWFHSYSDANYLTLLNEMYKSSGHPEWTTATPFCSRPLDCAELARITARNVGEAAFFAAKASAHLIFALQPNIVSNGKRLTQRERELRGSMNIPYWESCYQALRVELGRLNPSNYRLLDLSRSFDTMGEDQELFMDVYHFADAGQHLIAHELADRIDWGAIAPGPAVKGPEDSLAIVEANTVVAVTSSEAQGISEVRVSSTRLNRNLQIVFDGCVLPTAVTDGALVARIPHLVSDKKPVHTIYIIDGMTGEISPTLALKAPIDSDLHRQQIGSVLRVKPLRWMGEKTGDAWAALRVRLGRTRRKKKEVSPDQPNIYPMW